MKYLFLLLSVLFNSGAYIIFKSIANKPYNIGWLILFAGGLLLGAINTFFFTRALKNINLGIAYPAFSAMSISLIILISSLLFGEKIGGINIVGAVTVIIGIVLLTQ